MRSSTPRTSIFAALLAPLFLAIGLLATGLVTTAASAHEERPATFPDGTGSVPTYLGLDNARHRVVCKANSDDLIAAMPAGPLKQRNKALLRECRFHSIQDAINSITKRKTSIYVLPGVYTERTWASKEKSSYCGNLRTRSRGRRTSAAWPRRWSPRTTSTRTMRMAPPPGRRRRTTPARSHCRTPTSTAAGTTST